MENVPEVVGSGNIEHFKKWEQQLRQFDYSNFTLKSGNYEHLPLEQKIKLIKQVKIPTISVCEDVPTHYNYWKNNFNPKRNDCCNLRGSNNEELHIDDENTQEQMSLFDFE